MGVFIGQRFNDGILKQINTRIKKVSSNSNRSIDELMYLNSKTSWIKLSSDVNIDNSNELAKKYQLSSNIKQQNNFGNNGVYSLGTELGYKPFPGISNINVKNKGAFGSLREANINFKCWDLNQLTILELLYLRPYFPVLLEWGNTMYYDDKENLNQNIISLDSLFLDGKFNNVGDILLSIENNRQNYYFNYDAMYGYVKNYNWNLTDNGSYDCNITIVSSGDIIESLKINTIYNDDNDYALIKEWQRKKIFNNKDNFSKGTKLEEKLQINQQLEEYIKQIDEIEINYNSLGLIEETQTQFKGQGQGVKFDEGDYNTITKLTNNLHEISSNLENQQKINEQKSKLNTSLKLYKENKLSTENYNIKKDFEEYLKLIKENFNQKQQKLAKNIPEEFQSDFDSPDSPIYLFSDILSSKLNLLLYQIYKLGSKNTDKEFYINNNVKNTVFFENINNPYFDKRCYSIKLNSNKEETPQFPNPFVYIPLGSLLEMINGKLLLYESKNNLPFISIDNDINNNSCLTHPLQVSSDPSICIIPVQQEAIDLFNIKYNNLFDYNNYAKNKYEANLMFIYVNIGFISQVLHNIKDDKGNVYLQQFLSELMKGIQNSLGGINSFNVGYDENINKIKIVDTQQIPGLSDQDPSIIPTFGLSSITKNISLQSEIFSDLSTMIAIGAQAGNVSSIDSTSLYLFNKEAKITSRVLGKLIDNSQDGTKDPLEDIEERIRIQSTRLKNLIKYFSLQSIGNFSFSSEDAESNKSNLKDYLSLEKSSDKNTQALNIIPLKISLTLDGISGMKIGQVFRIPNNRLPEHYKDKIAFVITSLSHNVNNNIWDTIIDGQMILLDKNRGNYDYEYKSQNISSLNLNNNQLAFATEIGKEPGSPGSRENFDGWQNIYPKWVPIENKLNSNIIRISSMPAKNRNGNPHYGIDIAGPLDTVIISPVDGILSIGNDPQGFGGNYPKITDIYGNIHYFGHTKKVLKKNGTKVKAGEIIALLGNEGKSTSPHLHYEIRNNKDAKLDPVAFLNNIKKPINAITIDQTNGFSVNDKNMA